MWSMAFVSLIVGVCCSLSNAEGGAVVGVDVGVSESDEAAARSLLKDLDARGSLECNLAVVASWNYESNITEHNKIIKAAAELKSAEWDRERHRKIKEWDGRWQNLTDPDLKRQFKLLSVLGTAALSQQDLEEYNDIKTQLATIYSTAKACDLHNTSDCSLALEPDLTVKFRSSNNVEELSHLWKSWRDHSGRNMRPLFKKYVKLSNTAAQLNGFKDMGQMWLRSYEDPDFQTRIGELWKQLSPLYKEIHAYVRRKLRELHGNETISARGPIPAQLLGNMWAQTWGNIYDHVIPFKGKTSVDITPQMVAQNFTQLKMFQLSEEFFASLNLTKMPELFWNNSILKKPEGIELTCHASAWDFCDGKDYRIKQCTEITMEDLITAHHEMGHIEYFLLYKDQPLVYREGANPGFHEAVGDVLALSVATPKHLVKIGLLDKLEEDNEADINFLLNMALDKIAFLPFGYLMDKWRWDVFSGKIDEKSWNCAWWDLRVNVQGLKPPVTRSENDFDPGAKYHIPGDVPYVRYFVSFVLQFQLHKELCTRAGEYDPQDPTKPLHKCDIYQSLEAGKVLRDMLSLGSSKPWPEALKMLTGGEKMDASAIREYFSPLEAWLKADNAQHNEFVGWVSEDTYCVGDNSPKDKGRSNGNADFELSSVDTEILTDIKEETEVDNAVTISPDPVQSKNESEITSTVANTLC